MKIAVFGASGPTGQELVSQALARGASVSALVRDPARVAARPGLALSVGDVLDPAALAPVVAGADAVLSVLGAKPGRMGVPKTSLYSESLKRIVVAMRSAGVKRLVYCTSGGVEDHDPSAGWLYRWVFKPLFIQNAYDDMKLAEALLWGANDLEWIIARPTQLTDGPKTEKYRVSPRLAPVRGVQISRADLAHFMLDQVRATDWLHQTPTLAY